MRKDWMFDIMIKYCRSRKKAVKAIKKELRRRIRKLDGYATPGCNWMVHKTPEALIRRIVEAKQAGNKKGG